MSDSENNVPRFALVAHDACKQTLIDWIGNNLTFFEECNIFATGTTGGLLQDTYPSLSITRFKSGPLGGDQQLGAMICQGELDALFFFIDPMSPMPHDVDVKALTRLAIVYDVPTATSPATADCIVTHLSQAG